MTGTAWRLSTAHITCNYFLGGRVDSITNCWVLIEVAEPALNMSCFACRSLNPRVSC